MTAPSPAFTFLAGSGPLATIVPIGVDVDEVLADVADDSVSAPTDEVNGLREVIARARDEQVNLSIVVVTKDPPLDAQLRDLATVVGSQTQGTVLVLSPRAVGTFSTSIERVTLEAGQDVTYTGDPVVSANNFLDEITAPGPSWTGYSIVILAVIAATIAALAVSATRRWRRVDVQPAADTSSGPDAGVAGALDGDATAREEKKS